METRLQNLLTDLGLRPSLDAGLLDDPFHLILNGDGTILETAAERSNAVEDSYQLDRAHRHATFGLVRLCVVNICKHAKIRWIEATKRRSETRLVQETLEWLLQGDFEATPPM